MAEEKRVLVISRTYQKEGKKQQVFVAQISGGDLAGEVFRCEVWLNNQEQSDKRITSGNAYEVRRRFINTLLDLHENGWSRDNAAAYAHPKESFFDPDKL